MLGIALHTSSNLNVLCLSWINLVNKDRHMGTLTSMCSTELCESSAVKQLIKSEVGSTQSEFHPLSRTWLGACPPLSLLRPVSNPGQPQKSFVPD